MPRWADFVSAGNWQQLGIVDPERAAKVQEKDILNMMIEARRESQVARSPLESCWVEYDALYRLPSIQPGMPWDWRKQEWQSQIPIPEIRDKIRVARSLIKGGLLDSPEWFRVFGQYQIYDDDQIRFFQKWLETVAEASGIIDAYLNCLEDGFLYGSGCMALSIEDYVRHAPQVTPPDPQLLQQWQMQAWQAQMSGQQPPPPPQPTLSLDPSTVAKFTWKSKRLYDMYPDPRANSFRDCKWVIEESRAAEEDLEERFRAGIYDSLDDIGAPVHFEGDRQSEFLRRELAESKRAPRREHLLTEYTGSIYDREGKCVAKNWIVTAVNERAIVRIGPNPHFLGKSRYIWCTPLPYSGRVWGHSLIDSDAHVQIALTDFINLMLDDMRYSVLGAFQLDSSQSQEPIDPTTIEPGHVYHGRGNFLSKLQFNSTANAAWPILNKLEGIGDKSTQISEFVDGTPSSRGRPTAAEVNSKTSAGTAFIHGVMRDLERNDLEPALQLMFEYMLQFGGDRADPDLQALLQEWGGPPLDDMARFTILSKPFKIKVRGISMMMDRDSLVPRLMQLLQVMMQIGVPPPPQAKMLYTLITAMGFDPTNLGWPTNPDEYAQMLAQMQQAQMAGPPGAPARIDHGGAPSPAQPTGGPAPPPPGGP